MQANRQRVEGDRGFIIEATLVRIMKSRKTLGHAQLILGACMRACERVHC